MKVLNKVIKNYDTAIPVYDLQMNVNNPCFSLASGVISHNTIPGGSPARRCLATPKEDWLWTHVDYSQAELVVLAFLSGDPRMIQAFIDKQDMHQFIASKVFNKDYDKVTKSERKFAKTVVFGIVYGKSIENIAIEITNGDVNRAQGIFDALFKTFPGIKVWMDTKRDEVDKFGYVTTMFGNRIEIDMNEPGNGRYRKGVNAPIQGTASTIAGTSIYDFTEACEVQHILSLPIGFIHDAMDDVTPVETIFEYIDLMTFKLQDEIYQQIGMPMRIDFEIGVDSFNQCSLEIKSRENKQLVVEIEGEFEATSKLISRLSKASKFSVSKVEELTTKTTDNSWSEMFESGTAMKSYWGKTVTKNALELTIVFN